METSISFDFFVIWLSQQTQMLLFFNLESKAKCEDLNLVISMFLH